MFQLYFFGIFLFFHLHFFYENRSIKKKLEKKVEFFLCQGHSAPLKLEVRGSIAPHTPHRGLHPKASGHFELNPPSQLDIGYYWHGLI